jgi:polyisoprenoid-binding protein YceI
MKAWIQRLLVLFILLLLEAVPALAQRVNFDLDPARSTVLFTLKTSLHTVRGTFRLQRGKVMVDPPAGTASGSIEVSAVSGESGNSGRDSKMHRDILESQMYPDITFEPQVIEGHFEKQGDSHLKVKGTFRLHGQAHEMVIPVVVRVLESNLTFDADFSIPYIVWGLKNPSTFILRASDTVQVSVHASGRWMAVAAN